MRTLALSLTLLLVATAAFADGPVDGGVPADATAPAAAAAPPPAAAAPPPGAAAPPPAAAAAPTIAPATAKPAGPAGEAPYSLLGATPPPPPDAPAHARPTPFYRSALFWTSVALGAGAVAAIAVGAGLAATFHPRYALVSF